jgi:transitional endoplasmic reticulum ATPase
MAETDAQIIERLNKKYGNERKVGVANINTMASAANSFSNGHANGVHTDASAFYDALPDSDKAVFAEMLWNKVEPAIVHDMDSKGITLPGLPIKMTSEAASKILADHARAQNEECEVEEYFDAYPYDAAVAFVKALRQTYHLSDVKSYTVQGFFGPVKVKPEWRTVQLSHKPEDSVMVPVGRYDLPGIDGNVTTGFDRDRRTGKFSFYVNAEVKTKDRKAVLDLIALTKKLIASESIYKAKALRLSINGNGNIIEGSEPKFIDVSGISVDDLIFNEDVTRLLNMSLFTPIRKRVECVKAGISLSRKVLLSSKYGMGKSLTGRAAAALAVQNGWTFILVDNPKGLRETLEFAKRFQPCLVFVEDIDRVTNDRGQDLTNDLLNTLDGVLSKNDQIISVFTTNHAEKITPAVRRAGRLDVIVNVSLPDAKTMDRMIRAFSGELLGNGEDISDAVRIMNSFTPATIAEVCKSAKLSAIMDGRSVLIGQDIADAAIGMKHHHEFASGGDAETVSPNQHAGRQFTAMLDKSSNVDDELKALKEIVEKIAHHVL